MSDNAVCIYSTQIGSGVLDPYSRAPSGRKGGDTMDVKYYLITYVWKNRGDTDWIYENDVTDNLIDCQIRILEMEELAALTMAEPITKEEYGRYKRNC